MKNRRGCSRNRIVTYKHRCGPYCANPKCVTPLDDMEVHHIIPLSAGGKDHKSNMIQLCSTCHRTGNLHSRWKQHVEELLIWKTAADLDILSTSSMFCVEEQFAELGEIIAGRPVGSW